MSTIISNRRQVWAFAGDECGRTLNRAAHYDIISCGLVLGAVQVIKGCTPDRWMAKAYWRHRERGDENLRSSVTEKRCGLMTTGRYGFEDIAPDE